MISEKFADELVDKELRDAYVSAQTRSKISSQIQAIRKARGWSQSDFAERLRKPQSNVSRLENREYGSYTLNTLFAVAAELDVSLVVEFTTFSDFANRSSDLLPDHLAVPKFNPIELCKLLEHENKLGSISSRDCHNQPNDQEACRSLNFQPAISDPQAATFILNGRDVSDFAAALAANFRRQPVKSSSQSTIVKISDALPKNFKQKPAVAASWASGCV